MKITIDGIDYVPITDKFDADETAKAVIRMFVSGYYSEPECNVAGSKPSASCWCSACHSYRVAIAFLGGKPKCEEEKDPGFVKLYKNQQVN